MAPLNFLNMEYFEYKNDLEKKLINKFEEILRTDDRDNDEILNELYGKYPAIDQDTICLCFTEANDRIF